MNRVPAAVSDSLHVQMRVAPGAIPQDFAGAFCDAEGIVYGDGEFRFTTPAGVDFHYRKGRGLAVYRPEGPVADDDYRVFKWGTVFGAVAWMNGYFPLHASAVVAGKRAVAFTADSGGGKSTIAAALAKRGFAHLCDDTLALARSGDNFAGIPDRKPMKLWGEAARFLDVEVESEILGVPGKFYAPAPGAAEGPAIVTDLFVLETGGELDIAPIKGAERLIALKYAIYRPKMAAMVLSSQEYARWLVDLNQGMRMWVLKRSTSTFSAADFDSVAGFVDGLAPR